MGQGRARGGVGCGFKRESGGGSRMRDARLLRPWERVLMFCADRLNRRSARPEIRRRLPDFPQTRGPLPLHPFNIPRPRQHAAQSSPLLLPPGSGSSHSTLSLPTHILGRHGPMELPRRAAARWQCVPSPSSPPARLIISPFIAVFLKFMHCLAGLYL